MNIVTSRMRLSLWLSSYVCESVGVRWGGGLNNWERGKGSGPLETTIFKCFPVQVCEWNHTVCGSTWPVTGM